MGHRVEREIPGVLLTCPLWERSFIIIILDMLSWLTHGPFVQTLYHVPQQVINANGWDMS